MNDDVKWTYRQKLSKLDLCKCDICNEDFEKIKVVPVA